MNPEICKKSHTISSLLEEASGVLSRSCIPNPRQNAELLLQSVLGKSRMDLYLEWDKEISAKEYEVYRTFLSRRSQHEPIQYLLGETEFMSLPFRVNSCVMIPRPETEILVEKVIAYLQDQGPVRILDIGTGSGVIAIGLCKYLPQVTVDALDIREEILALAKENAERNGVADRIHFILGDIRSELFYKNLQVKYDVLVSNPPYVSKKEWDNLDREVRDYEPFSAICDGGDGLSFYRIFAEKAKLLLAPHGVMFFEIGFGQKEEVVSIFQEKGFHEIVWYPDLAGIPRVMQIKMEGGKVV